VILVDFKAFLNEFQIKRRLDWGNSLFSPFLYKNVIITIQKTANLPVVSDIKE
jgi:hypothetical protein